MTVSTTPSDLLAAQPDRGEWLVQNLGAADIYLARTEADCTPALGIKMAANEAISIDEPAVNFTGTAELWACTAAGTADVRILRVG